MSPPCWVGASAGITGQTSCGPSGTDVVLAQPPCLFLSCLSAAATAFASLACVCVGLISSGCVSLYSGSFTGLSAVPGTGAASLALLGGCVSGCPAQS